MLNIPGNSKISTIGHIPGVRRLVGALLARGARIRRRPIVQFSLRPKRRQVGALQGVREAQARASFP